MTVFMFCKVVTNGNLGNTLLRVILGIDCFFIQQSM